MKSDNKNIQKVVIVGGGTAGWMTAAALSNALQKQCQITLVESDDIGTIGVGEASIPPIKLFNQSLGINENEFVQATQGTFKLGIEFVNWGRLKHSYFHPFGSYGRQFDMVDIHHHWQHAYENNQAESLDNYCMAWAAAKEGRFSPPTSDARNVLSTYEYAYHFDAGLYAKFLRGYSEKKGLERIEGKICDVKQHSENDFIQSITLENGLTIEGDLFIDCSGIKGLLIEETLKTGYQDWSHWLPCDRAWALPSEKTELTPYTRSTANAAGWQWRIPLQHRTGNGHVYSSQFMNDQDALDILVNNLDSSPLGEPRLIPFKTGRRNKFWNKNVIAIGLSSGFLEPLESTSIHLIQASIAKLLALFPTRDFDPIVVDEYNRIATNEIENIRDFLILHYKLTERDDSEMWRYCKSMSIPDDLNYKIEHFKRFGRLIRNDMDLFGNASWLAVHIGQLNYPQHNDPLMQYRTVDAENWLAKLSQAMSISARRLPTHDEYINRFCKAK